MKRTLTAIVLVLAASAALALPAPKDIASAVNSGHLPQAEAMLHDVIKEKPGSAKAHYELGQVLAREGRKIEARQELLVAQRLDPSLKFATDPQRFNDLLSRLPAPTPASIMTPAEASPHPTAAAQATTRFPWGYVLLGSGALLLIWLFVRRSASAPMMMPAGTSTGGSAVTGGAFGHGPGSYSPTQASGSGLGGAVLGGIAGMAAGYGLAKVLESGSDDRHVQSANDNREFIPVDPSPQADYGAFDAGSGDSWDAGDGASSDQSW